MRHTHIYQSHKRIINPATKNPRDLLYYRLVDVLKHYSYLPASERVFILRLCVHKVEEGAI